MKINTLTIITTYIVCAGLRVEVSLGRRLFAEGRCGSSCREIRRWSLRCGC
uniref:Uncharacterized protein n=1 Tax=Passalora fulva TaxID=5499 RepID=A0A9Q8L9T2_PASFU